jgi:Indolepyruvate ferredoxin oxidoreductase, alpha and beta subunits
LEFILTQTKKIVENYLMAGGKNPEIILHDSDFGNEMISMLSRHFSGLPSNLIPYELHSTGRIGHDLITSLIALGYEKIYILTDPKLASEHIHIPLQLNLAKSMIKGVVKSYSEDFVKIIDNNDPEKVSEIIYKNRNGIKIKTKPFNPLGKPRGIVRVAMQSLQKESNKSNVIQLPKGSPYGTLDVNLEKCTICLSCVSGCPASALQDNPVRSTTFFYRRCLPAMWNLCLNMPRKSYNPSTSV